MATDAPDWQHVLVTEASAMSDSPDWTEVAVSPGGGEIGGGYASLTGPGESATPGELTQLGPFRVINTAAGGDGVVFQELSFVGFFVESNNLVELRFNNAGVENVLTVKVDGVVVDLQATKNFIIDALPTSSPGVSGALWNNGGVVNIDP